MSSDDIDVKKRAEKAALIHVGASFLKVPQAMRAAGFSDGDSQNPTLQQRVRRIIKDKLENENMSQALGVVRIRPNPSPVSDFSSNTTTIGSLDASSATEESFPLPRLNTVRSTASAAMKKAKNKRAMKKFSDTALKAATALYHDEQKKENGMSAKQVERMIKARFSGEGPCARSITRYVNEYKLVGTSPLKNGRPGEIPPHAFDSLCVGLESYISICVKRQRMKAMQIREAAQAVMAKWEDELRNLDCQKLTVADVECLLRWYGAWRGEKMSKSDKVSRLVGILEEKGEPPTIEEWTAEDEGRLQSLQNNRITLGDTAVGRKQVLFEQQMVAASITMSEDQWNRCVEMRKRKLEFEEVGREYEMATAGSLEMGEQVMEEHEVGAL